MLSRLTRRFERAVGQPAQTLRGRRTGSHPGDVVAEASHKGRRFVVVGVFELGGVRFQLRKNLGY